MPEAIRRNRVDLELGHPPAAHDVFDGWARKEDWSDSVENVDSAWDGLGPARLDDGTAPSDLVSNLGRQTGPDHEG